MAIFAPVYRTDKRSESVLARQQRARKRKRDRGDDSPSEDEPTQAGILPGGEDEEPSQQTRPLNYHPVNRKDPYHVAGLPRDTPLPPAPFPHAPAKDTFLTADRSIADELAAVNPPLYVPSGARPEDKHSSLRKRHLDNLTTILHRSLLKNDQQRASRAWALLLRTEIGGQSIDVRRNERWCVGAEIALRSQPRAPESVGEGDEGFGDAGLKLARDYYERLIIQYPHTPRTKHGVNALVIYPALFNIWIYDVQARGKRGRRKANTERRSSPDSASSTSQVMHSTESDRTRNENATRAVKRQELDEALRIAQRMDELMLPPPYDSSAALLELRGMLGLWLSDLYVDSAAPKSHSNPNSEDSIGSSNYGEQVEIDRQQREAKAEREKARQLFERARGAGVVLPEAVTAFLERDSDISMES